MSLRYPLESYGYCAADAIMMQLRVAACIVIVALVRVLNIAVPVLYRNAVNKLAEVSDLTHPRGGERPQTFTFLDVRLPTTYTAHASPL